MKITTKIEEDSSSIQLTGSQIFKTQGIYKPIKYDCYIIVVDKYTIFHVDTEQWLLSSGINKACWKNEKFVIANVKIDVTFDNIKY